MAKASGKPIVTPGDPRKYGALLLETLPAIIETEAQNEHYLAIVEKLMRKGEENLSPEENMLLNLLVHLIEDFEQRYYQPESATPLEVLHELMAANGLKQVRPSPDLRLEGDRLGSRQREARNQQGER